MKQESHFSKQMKDKFSNQSNEYVRYRPSYPGGMVEFIVQHVPDRNAAWDCGTGNGQLAVLVADHFEQVIATDLSEQQLSNAAQRSNITYRKANAEDPVFAEDQFDLVTVAQAIHWFDFDQFYAQVKRVLKADGIMAAIGYGLLEIDSDIDPLLWRLYSDILGAYWDFERTHINDGYSNIPFPFEEIKAPRFQSTYQWSKANFQGFLQSWSARQNYIARHQSDPLDLIQTDLDRVWPLDEVKEIRFPVFMRLGRNKK